MQLSSSLSGSGSVGLACCLAEAVRHRRLDGRSTALHSWGELANNSCLWLTRAVGQVASSSRWNLQPSVWHSGGDWGELWTFTLAVPDGRPNGCIRPVLKHRPRSATCMWVLGWQTHRRNEGEGRFWCAQAGAPMGAHCRSQATLWRDLSKSVPVATRKMVNYAWIGWSQRKLWWKLVSFLTCKSIVKIGYRGERVIEPSSSWFPPKFQLG